jgi:AcrR family transcriptional regulator
LTTDLGEATRDALIRAGEQLMAARGIDAADLTDIQAAAGQKNRSAVAYHFGDRAGLVRAIGAKHRAQINSERHRMIDRIEQDGNITIAGLVDAAVRPLAASLSTASGRDYIIILAEAAARLGTAGLFEAGQAHTDSIQRLNRLLMVVLSGTAAARRLRIGQAILAIPVLLADIARDINRAALTLAQGRRRVGHVTNFVAGALAQEALRSAPTPARS